MNHEEIKKSLDAFQNDAVDGNDVKGGGGPFIAPTGDAAGTGTPMPGDEMGGPPAPGAELPHEGGDLPQIPFEGPGPIMGPPGPLGGPHPFPRP